MPAHSGTSGVGDPGRTLTSTEIAGVVDGLLAGLDIDGRHIVLLIPDRTRSAPVPLMLRLLHDHLAPRAAQVDVVVALGTHQPLDDAGLDALVGAAPAGRATDLPAFTVHNHAWSDPRTYAKLGTLTAHQIADLSSGRLNQAVDVRINRLVANADLALVCGPVFPHEVVGFSGGNKYFFPGVCAPELINLSHWLGALITSHDIIGAPGTTPVRALIDRAAAMIPTPRQCLAMVVRPGGTDLCGLYAGTPEHAWADAADLSARVHIRYVDHPHQRVLSVIPERYQDMWTAAKGMYKVEPVVADDGEIIIYAPHITQFSATHGETLAEIGYHIRDYFLANWNQYCHYPLGVLAHSTHLRGAGSIHDGVEHPRIRVTLATGINQRQCTAHGLGYVDPATIDVQQWLDSSDPNTLVVTDAGEQLFRIA